jgi:hypothetical protein
MDTDTTTPVEKTGISRRAVIVGGAAGAAAFWSVPVIDSITQRAAAASGCQPVVLNSVSFVFVVFTFTSGGTTTTYFAGFKQNCDDQGANNGITKSVTCNGVTYAMNGSVAVTISPTQNGQSSATHLTGGSGGTAAPYVTCDSGSGKISPVQTGVAIVAYFWFTGGGNGGAGAACTSSGGMPICVSFD